MLKRLPWRLVLISLLLTGCTRMCGVSHSDMKPEEVVEAYLDVSLNMTSVSERRVLLQYTTGNLKSAIESASDDTIQASYVDKTYNIQGYSVVERLDRTPRETEITFRLQYKVTDKSIKEEMAPDITTENTVAVVKTKGLWRISDVMGNNETTIDFPISAASEIKAKAPK